MNTRMQELQTKIIQTEKMRKMVNLQAMIIVATDTICFFVSIIVLEPGLMRTALQTICFIAGIIGMADRTREILKITKQINKYKIEIERCILNGVQIIRAI